MKSESGFSFAIASQPFPFWFFAPFPYRGGVREGSLTWESWWTFSREKRWQKILLGLILTIWLLPQLRDIVVIRVPEERQYCDFMIIATGRNTRHVKWVSLLINCLSSLSSWFNFFLTQLDFYLISSSNISVSSPLWSSRSTRTKWIPPTMSPEGSQYLFNFFILKCSKCKMQTTDFHLESHILHSKNHHLNAGRVRKTPLVVGLQWTWEILCFICLIRSTLFLV